MSANKKKHYPPYDRVFEDYYNGTNNSMKDRMDYIRSKIEHEDNLISNRINWLLAIQGILITSYVANYKDLDGILQAFVLVFGLVSALNISTNICLGELSLGRIRSLFDEKIVVRDFISPKTIYGQSHEEEAMREEERAVIEKGSGVKDFYLLGEYDKRLILGDYKSKSSCLRYISKTWLLPGLCIVCWIMLIVFTIYTDNLSSAAKGKLIKVEVSSPDTSYVYMYKTKK
jgi:hypothetical protein